ncbi:MAG: adenylyltransferase/cytidyltransferase family protein [Simkaniaceae bacterium]|nr:adenylyltransferase/cytidyltransferase family protein [Simkaniaceae bacterium]
MHVKIKSLNEIQKLADESRAQGKSVVQCHGVFDLLHPGHIRHFKEAKKRGDVLIVTITPDRFVNKGPGRPAFTERLRLESLAALESIDYVVLNDSPTAVGAIYSVKPNIYVKGSDYKNAEDDITGKITDESEAVKAVGGAVHFTDDIVFSSSQLINQFIDPISPEIDEFMSQLKKEYSVSQLLDAIEGLSSLKVGVIGDAIIDEYQYVEPLGQSGKGLHMAAVCKEEEIFLGGALIVARHLAAFTPQVTLFTAIGFDCPYRPIIEGELDSTIKRYFVETTLPQTLVKKRYVLRDGLYLSKLFETYSSNEPLLNTQVKRDLLSEIKDRVTDFDLLLVADFGNGLICPHMAEEISQMETFLSLNTQINSGNRGYHVITRYSRADFISLNEPEIRLAAHDKLHPIENIIKNIHHKLKHPKIAVTHGVKGVTGFDGSRMNKVPAFASRAVDRVGAGDTFFALASLCAAKGYPLHLASFIGSLAAALDVQIVGNREAIDKVSLCKFVSRLFK